MILKTSSTEMGGAESAFPKTRWSVIRDAGDAESPASRQSLEDLARLYWRPIYAYFRRKWRRSNEEAKDLTQEFFAALSDKGFLEGLRPENGRFRSYVMAALDNFARGDHRRATALKRGGGVAHLSFEISAGFEPSTGASPEEEFERDWAESVLSDALQEMEQEYASQGKESEFRLFEARDIEASTDGVVSYEELSGRFGMRVTQVTHALYFARKRLRELVLRRVRDSVTSAGEAEEEMIRLFSERAR
jgi:RNA polymerase sigma-70 factor (ECF subfamily)